MSNAPVVILVRPQMGENIGAVARAMSNFGLSELRIAAPRDGWPNPKAQEMAAGAENIVNAAQVFPDFRSAMADIHLAYATTARPRDMEKRVVEPPQAMQEVREHLAAGHKIALVFGPERSGLENDDLGWCDTLITIPTAPENQSLNIAQSAVLIGYEWFKGQGPVVARELQEMATKDDWQGLFGQLEEYLDAVEYFRVAHKKPVMMQNLRNMLMRAAFSPQEVRSFRGMLRSLWERRMMK
jgi:tRNA/rRNA methyltransferase